MKFNQNPKNTFNKEYNFLVVLFISIKTLKITIIYKNINKMSFTLLKI